MPTQVVRFVNRHPHSIFVPNPRGSQEMVAPGGYFVDQWYRTFCTKKGLTREVVSVPDGKDPHVHIAEMERLKSAAPGRGFVPPPRELPERAKANAKARPKPKEPIRKPPPVLPVTPTEETPYWKLERGIYRCKMCSGTVYETGSRVMLEAHLESHGLNLKKGKPARKSPLEQIHEQMQVSTDAMAKAPAIDEVEQTVVTTGQPVTLPDGTEVPDGVKGELEPGPQPVATPMEMDEAVPDDPLAAETAADLATEEQKKEELPGVECDICHRRFKNDHGVLVHRRRMHGTR